MLLHSYSNKKFYTHMFIHIITYFIIIYVYHYYIVFEEYEDKINKDVKFILEDKELYTKFNLKSSDKKTIDIIINTNRTTSNDNDQYIYDIIMYIFLFLLFIIYMFLIGEFFINEVKIILYDGILAFIYLLVIKYFFINNIELEYDNISKQEIYDNIVETIEKNIKG